MHPALGVRSRSVTLAEAGSPTGEGTVNKIGGAWTILECVRTTHTTTINMPKGIYKVPVAVNEPVKSYAPGSAERKELQAMLKEMRGKELDIPMYIGGQQVRSVPRLYP